MSAAELADWVEAIEQDRAFPHDDWLPEAPDFFVRKRRSRPRPRLIHNGKRQIVVKTIHLRKKKNAISPSPAIVPDQPILSPEFLANPLPEPKAVRESCLTKVSPEALGILQLGIPELKDLSRKILGEIDPELQELAQRVLQKAKQRPKRQKNKLPEWENIQLAF